VEYESMKSYGFPADVLEEVALKINSPGVGNVQVNVKLTVPPAPTFCDAGTAPPQLAVPLLETSGSGVAAVTAVSDVTVIVTVTVPPVAIVIGLALNVTVVSGAIRSSSTPSWAA